ncbi:G-patch domain and KOW motifs-containing protein [Meleagris gallopavo]|uniref:G-patch domain and KOW motifs-containing protein n=1 Tax=Meleagris gallopavo TaxID=9103 RepID=UPI000549B230|nr:G-patch domain and KOW motifs-containing protein [Meleagris gallopavo]
MQVEDLLSADSCVCRTDDGRLVEGLQEEMLETVIPRGPNDRVMVVLGEQRGQVGRILERDPERGRAVVQLAGGGPGAGLRLPLPLPGGGGRRLTEPQNRLFSPQNPRRGNKAASPRLGLEKTAPSGPKMAFCVCESPL